MSKKKIKLDVLMEIPVDTPVKQLRAATVSLGKGAPKGIVALYSSNPSVMSSNTYFHFPKDTLKMIMFTEKGEVLWKRDLGRGVIPGVWFCPMFSFDLDGDGVDEIFFVNNTDPHHPFAVQNYVLERVHSVTGRTICQNPWPEHDTDQNNGNIFRYFIAGGYVKDEPVLVTGQGTYLSMFVQGWKPDMTYRWTKRIDRNDPGARGSHCISIADMDQDGIHEVFWGERCIELDKGTELFCADRDTYKGHSDTVQPVFDRIHNKWYVYTCREKDPDASPRVVMFDNKGQRVWGEVDEGHIHMGWVARLGEEQELIATAIRIGYKTIGPYGYFNHGLNQFSYKALTGEPYPLPYKTDSAVPVDINGDGYHELISSFQCGDNAVEGQVMDHLGNIIGNIGSPIAMGSKFADHPGEQLLSFDPSGKIRIWVDRNAEDSKLAIARYNDPLYKINQRLTGSNNKNIILIGGI